MPPNPSKMAPIQMQSSPIRRKSRDNATRDTNGLSNSRMREKTKLVQNQVHGHGQVQLNKRTKLPEFNAGGNQNYAERKSASPDGGSNYAGAKFSEAPAPECVPMPPAHWLQTMAKPRAGRASPKKFSSSGPSHFDKFTKDLKMILKVEA